MDISPISSNLLNLFTDTALKTEAIQEGGSFADVFKQAFETAEQTDAQDKSSAVELLAGTSDDFAGLLLDAQKAEIALNLSLQLRNKLLEAYTELMRMQV